MKKAALFILTVLFFCRTLFIGTYALSAKACALICADTKEVIYSQNGDMRLAMASTTKIMTAFILCEQDNLDRKIEVKPEDVAVEGTSMGLAAGDTVTLYDLLYGMMLPSGNDAAMTAARAIGGNVQNFVLMMNEKAERLGLKNTSFATPSGLDADTHYTTALDLAVLTAEALKNPDFAKAVSTKQKTLTIGGRTVTLTNHNRLVREYDDVTGVKTGFTKKAGRCLVSSAEREGKRVVFVTLNDGNDWADHRKMLDLGLSSVHTVDIRPSLNSISLSVSNGETLNIPLDKEKYSLCCLNGKDYKCRVKAPSVLYAPVKAGDIIGTVEYLSDGHILDTVYLKSDRDIGTKKPSKWYLFTDTFKYILGS